MAIKPMFTLSFNGGDTFEIIDQEARNNIAELKELHPATGKVGQILEVETVDENSKPLTYRAVDNNPNIEVDETLTQKGMAADAKATGEALKNISVDEILTLAEYQALSEEEKDSNKTFYIDDEDIININDLVKITASHIAFDNANTTLVSREVQGALVEVDNKVSKLSEDIECQNEKINQLSEKNLSDFENDLYYSSKENRKLSFSLNDFEFDENDFYRYSCNCPSEVLHEEDFKIRIYAKANNYIFELEQTRDEIEDYSIDRQNKYLYTYVSSSYEDSPVFIDVMIEYGYYDEGTDVYIYDDKYHVKATVANDDTMDIYIFDELLIEFIELSAKKISKEVLDLPKEITNTFVVSYDCNAGDYTAHYEEIAQAVRDNKTVLLYQDTTMIPLDNIDSLSAWFTSINYTPSAPKGKKITLYSTIFMEDGTVDTEAFYISYTE